LEKIGQGGMGVVYRARQVSLGRVVAVKLLPFGPFNRPEAIDRFRAEASAAAGLQHPNIVGIHEVGEHEGQPFFSMDYVEGQTLADRVRDQPMSPRSAAGYLKIIAEAVEHAHQRGILHRDLKPANVLIDTSDQPRITDFGLAKRIDDFAPSTLRSAATISGQVLGSPNFMSPEQAEGRHKEVGPTSDVYGLGGLLYHLLTRQPPFQADTLTTLLKQVVEAEPIPPRLVNPSVPKDLETICLKCLEKEPAKRYPTAQALADELSRFLSGYPVQARPVGAIGKARRWGRRNPRLAGAVGVALLSLLAGVAGMGWQWNRARQMAQAELRQRERAEAGEMLARQGTYAADMHLAQLALGDNNRTLAISLLDKYRPDGKTETGRQKRESDLRGWEWRYLWQLCQGDESFTLHQYARDVNAVAVSADGTLLAVATWNETALWDLSTRRPLTNLPYGGTSALAFSPTTNLIAAGTWNDTGKPIVRLLDPKTAKVANTLAMEGNPCSLAFSPDGKLLAVFDPKGKVRISEQPSGRNWAELDVPPNRYGGAGVVRFSPDGDWLAIGEDYGRLRLLNLRTRDFVSLESQPNIGIGSVAFSPNSELLAAGFGYLNGTIRLWETRTRSLRGQLTNHLQDVTALVFTGDGRHLVSASHDGTIRLWDVARQTEVRCYQSSREGLTTLALLPDGGTLVSGGLGGRVCFWEVAGSGRATAYTNLVISQGFEAFSGLTHSDFAPGSLNPRVLRRFGLAFTPDSRSFITMDREGTLIRWDAQSLKASEDLPVFGSNHWAVAISSDGRWLATGDFPGGVTIWDWATRQVVANLAVPFEWAGFLGFSQSGRFLICRTMFNDYTCNVKLWRTAVWSEVAVPAALVGAPWSVDLSPDDGLLACGYSDGAINLYAFPSCERQSSFRHKGNVTELRFSRDGQELYSTSFDGSVCLWDVPRRLPLGSLQGHPSMALGAALSPDGRRLATGGSTVKDAVKLWDLASHREILSLQGRGNWYLHVTFSPDGNTLTATALSGCTEVWHAPSWEEIEAVERERETLLR
jgi:WD40 repeat protein